MTMSRPSRRTPRTLALLTGAAALASISSPSLATLLSQPQPERSAAPSASPSQTTNPAALRAARDFATTAILDLQSSGIPSPAGYRLAAIMLESAHTLAPNDDQILRLLIDAWGEVGDRDKVFDYTVKLVSLMSELKQVDTVSLLRLISGRIARLQSVDDRLAEYDRFLSPEWDKKLDESVRSRLALDAALLLREKGDAEGFISKLTLATTLDSTNKDAAALAVTTFSSQADDAVSRLTLLINLLKADPFDPETHIAIGRELAAGGAFAQARRFFLNYQQLTTRLSIQITPAEIAEYQTLAWNVDGADRLLSQSRLQVEQERARIAAERRRILTEDPNATDAPDPDDYRLAMEVERVRAAAAAALGDDAQIDYVSQELETTVARRLAVLQDPNKRPPGFTDAEAAPLIKSLNAELMWMRLWIGRNFDGAVQILEAIEKDPEANQQSLACFQGWVRLRRGQLDGAAEILAPLASSDPLAAIGLAVIAEKRNDTTAAAAQLTSIYQANPGTLAGAYARARAEVLLGKPPSPPPESPALNALAAAVPDWLEGMIGEPKRVFSVMAAPVFPRIGSLDISMVRLSILNLSPIPLGIGPDRPIQSSMLLAPRVTIAYQPQPVGNAATVVRVDRRLRLLPQEKLEVDVWADLGPLGFILDQVAVLPAEIRWKVLQGFSIDEHGIYVQGPMNVSCDSGLLSRAASTKAGMEPAAMVSFITTGTSEDVLETMLVIRNRAQMPRDPADKTTAEADAKLADTFTKRFASLNQSGKLSLLAAMPTPLTAPWFAPLVHAARTDSDPAVKLFAIITTVSAATDPFLAECMQSTDARIAEAAALLKHRLEDGEETYGTLKAVSESAPAQPATTDTALPNPSSSTPALPTLPPTTPSGKP